MARPELTNWIAKLLDLLNQQIGNFGWTVVVFSIILKLVLSPLDIWQKISMTKQQRAMAELQPQLEKLQRQYANNPDILKQKQYEIQKKSGFNMFASCLPLIVTMIVFFVVFDGFRKLVEYENQVILYNLNTIYVENIGLVNSGAMTIADLNAKLADAYKIESWLWVKNVFMSDIGTNVIPSLDKFVTGGFGGINAILPEGLATSYDVLVGPAMLKYNKAYFWDFLNWNGYFLLPILSIATSFLTTKFMQKSQPQQMTGTKEQQEQQKNTMKVLNYMMPLMLGFFAIMYSAAFAIYYFMSNVLSVATTLIYNAITKGIDKKKQQN